MYKSRLHEWGLDKNLKDHEARAIIHMHARWHRQATRMRLRDRPVDVEKAYSHLKRKGISIDDVLHSDAASLPDLVCETPAVSPSPTHPELQKLMTMTTPQDLGSPRTFRMVEMLFADAREYVFSSIRFEYDHNRSREQSLGLGDFQEVRCRIPTASYFFVQPQEVPVSFLVGNGCFNLEKIVEDKSCEAALWIIDSIAMLLERKHRQKRTALMLCKQLYSASSISKSRRQPITFMKLLSKIGLLLHNDDAPDFLLATVHVLIDSLKSILGPVHIQTVHAAVILSRVTRSLYGPEGLLEPLETLQSSLREHGLGIREDAMIINEIITIHISHGHHDVAHQLTRQLAQRRPNLSRILHSLNFYC